MADGLTMLDGVLIGLALMAMAAVGAWAGRRGAQRRGADSEEFFFAGRSLWALPLGLSLATGGLAAVVFAAGPGETYWVGLKLILLPALAWTALPLVVWCIVPLYGHLRLESVYEYLELRYDASTRAAAGGVYCVGMLLWLGGLLALPVGVLQPGVGLNGTTLTLLVAMGGTVTLYTYLGGMKAAVWTDAIQFTFMAVALLVLIAAAVSQLSDDGPGVRQIAEQLGRTHIVDLGSDQPPEWAAAARRWSVFSAGWSIWAVVPYMALIPLFFVTADQATLQRFFSARDRQAAEASYLISGVLFTLMAAAVIFLGLALLTVYHENARTEIPPAWVAHSATDPETGASRIDAHTPIDATNIGELTADGRILDPNTSRPFTQQPDFDPAELIDSRGRVDIDRLANRAPGPWGGERLLRRGGDHLLAHFVDRHLPRWLIFLAVAAAVMATLDSGIISLATLAVVDFHRRFGWAERWLASRCNKLPDELDQTDELRLGRPLVAVFGIAVIGVAALVVQFANVTAYLFGVLGLLAGPLLGIFLLGLFTRKTTETGALAAMAIGLVTAVWATLGHYIPAIWPFDGPLGTFRPFLLGLAATITIGYASSLLFGTRKTRTELSGLVAGLGRWGVLLETEIGREKEEVHWIEIDGDEPPDGPPDGPPEDLWS